MKAMLKVNEGLRNLLKIFAAEKNEKMGVITERAILKHINKDIKDRPSVCKSLYAGYLKGRDYMNAAKRKDEHERACKKLKIRKAK